MASGDGYLTWNPEEAIAQLQLESAALDVGDPVQTASDIISDAAPRAAKSIAHLAVHSKDEKIRLSAAKYIIDRTVAVQTHDDPFAKLLESMTD